LAGGIIRSILQQKGEAAQLFNLNIPTAALAGPAEVRVVPMDVARYGEHFIRRQDPKGRTYYWATSDPPPRKAEHETDLTALKEGHVTLTPLKYDMTHANQLDEMRKWRFQD
jgi:5'-nucleotidase